VSVSGASADDLACHRRALGQQGSVRRVDHPLEVRAPDGWGKLGACKGLLLAGVGQGINITLRALQAALAEAKGIHPKPSRWVDRRRLDRPT
jgi:hypothetical protein